MSRLTERVENFNKAFEIYKESIKFYDTEKVLTQMALVQSFEVCFELAWKCLKDYMYEQGVEANYPMQVIKEAFNKDTLQDGQLWIDMLKARNATSHEYNMDKINQYLKEISTSFFDELSRFQVWLGGLNE